MNDNSTYCVALDQGTFSSRALVYSSEGRLIRSAQKAISLNRIDQHRVEQSAEEILNSILIVLNEVLYVNKKLDTQIKIAGLTTQRSSIVAWRKSTGECLSPVLSWQDTRAWQWLNTFDNQSSTIEAITKLRLSPHYGVSKIRWLIENNLQVSQAIQQGDCIISPLASYLLFHMTQHSNIAIDAANASRMLLLNFQSLNWDNQLLKLFSIDGSIFPECKNISFNYGTIKDTDICINVINGDQNSALYQSGIPDNTALRINIGTGAFVLTPVEDEVPESEMFSNSGLLAGVSNSNHTSNDLYIEGTVNGAASALQWLEKKYSCINVEDIISKNDLIGIDPPIFINTIGGLGSPFWRSEQLPYFLDYLPNKENTPQTVLAVLESIIFLLMVNIERIQKIKPGINFIHISGGLSNLSILCQTLADLSQLEVHQSNDSEASAKGIAWLAFNHYHHLPPKWQSTQTTTLWTPENNKSLSLRYEKFNRAITI